ncbi:MAG: GNAT family N-acetyltransferase [Bacteroidota bacterium]
MTDRKTTYQQFCNAAPDLPVFMQPWYLDAVCKNGVWDVVLLEKGGRVISAWPLFLKKKLGRAHVSMPVLGRWMGPYLLPEFRRTSKESGLLEELLDQLPVLTAVDQDFNYTVENWLPFYWRGFRQTTRYSYYLNVNDLDAVWQGMAADYRNQKIPKAKAAVRIQSGGSTEEFYRIHNLSYARQGLKAPFSFEFFKGLDDALAAHQQRELFFAYDLESGQIAAVAYLIWDRSRAYLLMAGDDPAYRQTGASVLLNWELIRYTHETLHLPVFDFAGSMIKSVERVRRQFGAQQQAYFRIQKEWSALWKWGKLLLR